jgi:hypothetical protein
MISVHNLWLKTLLVLFVIFVLVVHSSCHTDDQIETQLKSVSASSAHYAMADDESTTSSFDTLEPKSGAQRQTRRSRQRTRTSPSSSTSFAPNTPGRSRSQSPSDEHYSVQPSDIMHAFTSAELHSASKQSFERYENPQSDTSHNTAQSISSRHVPTHAELQQALSCIV